MSWQKFITLPDGSKVGIFFVLPLEVYSEFKVHIQPWCEAAGSPPFDVQAAYNIVPVAFVQVVGVYYKIPFVNEPTPWYDNSYRENLKHIVEQNDPDTEKFKQFCGVCSVYRGSLNRHNDIKSLEIRPFTQRKDLGFYFDTHRKHGFDVGTMTNEIAKIIN